MGVGNVGCCDKNTTLKNSEISVQSVTYREGNEDYIFSPNTISLPRGQADFQVIDMLKRMKKLKHLKFFYTLTLKIVNLPTHDLLIIKPTGLIESSRGTLDGYIFFGCKYKQDEIIINDYKLPLKDPEQSRDLHGRFFMIYYNLDSESYWIKDLNKGPGLFIRLDFALVMKDGMIINIGNSFLLFNFKSKITSNPEVEIRKLGDDNYRVDLSGLDCVSGVIIGRGHNCKVRIRDESLSKNHATLTYAPTSGWILADGDMLHNASTNGTWLYASEEFEIYDQMFFKISQIVFQANLTK
ncbi:hypothetical protein SteCoe_6890 [Stentor coeruleus]|uniref:FHA domain-containing protein n=1 Tax=Stentor coeruleus TaxID=5963 RepID=A0A1R2CNZ3_9CILI|nr:hypothetical protein SteCoe_6890 [Stentor coeruleus]